MAEEGRKIGLAMDFSKGSKAALKWALDGLIRKGDTLFIIHVMHPQALESRNLLWATSGSRMSSHLISLFYLYFCSIESHVILIRIPLILIEISHKKS